MNKLSRILVLLLVLCMLCTAGMPAMAEPAADALQDDGLLRVHLKSLSDPENLTLTLKGSYTVEHDAGFRFRDDTQIVVSDGGDGVYLCIGGMMMNMGSSFTLTRQASDAAEQGLYIAESEKGNLYPGDLEISIADGGGLFPVLIIGMEDYLTGVVPYEMSDSWPLEALKAQAVAARTYAIQSKRNAGVRNYDVVDTAGDQVFKGYNPEYTNAERAVNETCGIVGTYKGDFAICYYTASNGGEIALPGDIWGNGGDFGYLSRGDDPYDLENKKSLVRSLEIAPDGSGNEGLRAMLDAGLIAAAQEMGLPTDGLQLEQILSIEPVEPAVEGSRMFTKLRFSISASHFAPQEEEAFAITGSSLAEMALEGLEYLMQQIGEDAGGEAPRIMAQESIPVDIDVYSQIKDELGMGMNSRDCELVSVRRDDERGFVIELRRYGHGVGMSQRGAQVMAGNYGMSFRDILSFYYPGMLLETMEWDAPALQPVEDLPDNVGRARPEPTPTPTPAPLPPLQEGEYYAIVDVESTPLNLRSEPGTHSRVITTFADGRRLIVCGEENSDGWVPVKTAEYSGFVKTEYLKTEE